MFTALEYQTALERIRTRIIAVQLTILQTLCDAPGATLSADELRKRLGEATYQYQSSHYSRFAHMLGDALDYVPVVRKNGTKQRWLVIFRSDAGKDKLDSEFLALHPELVQALFASGVISITDPDFPEEINPSVPYWEGAKKQITVNAYERNLQARQACIARYQAVCSACDFDFFERYGDIGKEYIQVHHLKQLSKISKRYKVNPITDLRPVCPNCHVMLHRKNPPYTPEEMRDIIKEQAKKREL